MPRSGLAAALGGASIRIPGLLLACALLWTGCSTSEPGVRIVLITLDTLRYDSFAGPRTTMPRTRELAEQGLVFRRSFSATSTTQPTHASMFTGLHPWQHGVPRNGMVLADDLETIAERLQGRGFETVAVIGSFPLGGQFGFDQGFDRYDDEFAVPHRGSWTGVEVPGERFYSLADSVTERAIAEIDRTRAARQFFWFHYFDAHQPYGDTGDGSAVIELDSLEQAFEARMPQAPGWLLQARRYYDGDVESLDRSLARLFARLAADAEIETHIVITADHGESFGEQGLLGHGDGLPNEQIQIPLVIVSPRVAPGERALAVGTIDIATTLDVLGGGPGFEGGGVDLTSDPASWPADRPVVGMRRSYQKPRRSVRPDGRVEWIEGPQFYLADDSREYVGYADALEANDGEPVGEAERERALALFDRFAAELEGRPGVEKIDPETQRALEALGYTR